MSLRSGQIYLYLQTSWVLQINIFNICVHQFFVNRLSNIVISTNMIPFRIVLCCSLSTIPENIGVPVDQTHISYFIYKKKFVNPKTYFILLLFILKFRIYNFYKLTIIIKEKNINSQPYIYFLPMMVVTIRWKSDVLLRQRYVVALHHRIRIGNLSTAHIHDYTGTAKKMHN